jgi:peptidoglycan L-alanyl-D-glutamate endopeptidase CwlK
MTAFKELSVSRINTLDSRLVHSAMKVFDKCMRNRIALYIVWGKRSDEEQELLFRYGRDIPGSILTTRRGGHSAHNYGMALDFCLLQDAHMMTWEDCYPRTYWRQKWWKVVQYFEEEGWEAGWRWPSFEPGHVENLLGKTISELKNEREQAKIRDYWDKDVRRSDSDQEFFL